MSVSTSINSHCCAALYSSVPALCIESHPAQTAFLVSMHLLGIRPPGWGWQIKLSRPLRTERSVLIDRRSAVHFVMHPQIDEFVIVIRQSQKILP